MSLPRWLAVCLVSALTSVAAAADVPSLRSAELATGRYAHMHMLLEKTFLQIDVATIDIRFGDETRDQLAALARESSYSEELAARITSAILQTDRAVVQLEFERDVSFDRWLESVRENLRLAYDARLIDQEAYSRVYHGLPDWFGAVRERGFEDGDRLVYGIRPKRLHTVLVASNGGILVDQTDTGAKPPRVLLAGYFAPGTEFREPLIRSLFEQ